MSEPSTLLGIYLNDHLAGATGGLALFRRATSSAQGASKAELAELTQQVTQDRQSLLALIDRAERQAQKLEELRLHAAARALTGPDRAPTGGHTTTGS